MADVDLKDLTLTANSTIQGGVQAFNMNGQDIGSFTTTGSTVNSVTLTASGDGNDFLSNDGTYKVVPTTTPSGNTGSLQYNLDGVNFGGFGQAAIGPSVEGIKLTAPLSNGIALTQYVDVTDESTVHVGYSGFHNEGQLVGDEIERININNTLYAYNSNGNVNIGGSVNINSAKLSIDSTSSGFLPPRMTTTQRDLIGSPITGLQIFNTTDNVHQHFGVANWESAGNVTTSSLTTFELITGSDKNISSQVGTLLAYEFSGEDHVLVINAGANATQSSNYILAKGDGTRSFHIRYQETTDNSVIEPMGASTLDLNATKIRAGTTIDEASAILELDSTTSGYLPPRMTQIQRDAIIPPKTGLKLYNTTTKETDTYDGIQWTASCVSVLNFFSLVAQTPATVNAPQVVDFGSGTINTNYITALANVFTAVIGKTYTIVARFTTGRTVNTGVSSIALQPFINGAPVPKSLITRTMPGLNFNDGAIYTTIVRLNAGDTFHVELANYGIAGFDGGLIPLSITAIPSWIPGGDTSADAVSAAINIFAHS